MRISVKKLKHLIKEAMEPKEPIPVYEWLDAWDQVLQANSLTVEDLPISDVVSSEMAQLAIEKMAAHYASYGIPPEEALEFAQDRDRFAVKFYDPYVDQFKRELGLDEE